MKLRNLMGALVALAGIAVAPSAAFAKGDIMDIRCVDQTGAMVFGTANQSDPFVCSPDHPLTIGDTLTIRVRMFTRNWADVADKPEVNPPKTWTFKPGALGGSLLQPPKLAIRVGSRTEGAVFIDGIFGEKGNYRASGVPLVWDELDNPDANHTYYTDFYFQYEVKPGDLGMPITLETDAAGGFLLQNVDQTGVGQWMLVDTATDKDPTVHFADFCLAPQLEEPDSWPNCGTSVRKQHFRTVDLSEEGAFVKTIDFGPADSEGTEWRDVYPGMDASPHADPEITLNGSVAADDNVTVYVWTEKEDVAVPVGGVLTEIAPGYTRQVLAVTVKKGESSAKFKLAGAEGAAVGAETTIYLCAVKKFPEAGTAVFENTTVQRTVKVVKAPEPTVRLYIDGTEATKTVTADPEYQSYKARLTFKVVPKVDVPVTVTFDAKVNGDDTLGSLAEIFDDNILRIANGDFGGDPIEQRKTSVTISPETGTAEMNVYVLGTTAKATSKGVYFTLTGVSSSDSRVKVTDAGCTLKIKKGVPTIVSAEPMFTTEDGEGTITTVSGSDVEFALEIADTYKNLYDEDTGYTFIWKVPGGEDIDPEDGIVMEDGVFTGFATFFNLGESELTLQVKAPDGSQSAPVKYRLSVVDSKKTTIAFTDPNRLVFCEGEETTLKLGLTQPYKGTGYIFLDGDADKLAYVDSTLLTEGAQIDQGKTEVATPRSIRFLDGTKDLTVKALLCTDEKDKTKKVTTYVSGTLSFTVTNKPPVLTSVTAAGQYLDSSRKGQTLPREVPMGVKKTFTLTADDVPADLTNALFKTKWVIEGQTYEVFGDPSTNIVTHTFLNATPAGMSGEEVRVYLKDKDMSDYPANPSFYFYVKVAAKPHLDLTTSAIGGVFNEDDTANASVTLTLSEPATAPILVKLTVQDTETGRFRLRLSEGSVTNAVDAAGNVQSNVYLVTIGEGVRVKNILASDMDGTNDTLAGLDLNAEVISETTTSEGVPWKEFYTPSETVTIRVKNVPPAVIRPNDTEVAFTNMNASANTPYTISYGATDVKADLGYATNGVPVGLLIDISVDGVPVLATNTTSSAVQTTQVTFDGEGAHSVVISFTDKDQESSYRTLNFYVQPSKRLKLSAHGPAPALGSSGGYSSHYASAPGLGAGRVYAGETGPQKVANFIHSYSFTLATSAVDGWAYGYLADGKPDDGSLTPAPDKGIDSTGGWTKGQEITSANAYDYTTQHPFGKLGYDSFVYGWACNNTESSKGSGDNAMTATFVLNVGKTGHMSIPLPKEEKDAKSYPEQSWEAIFSREFLRSDNCGDINLDGIPDVVLARYGLGVIDPNTQTVVAESDEGDLKDVSDYNGDENDNPRGYEGESQLGDFLPATADGMGGLEAFGIEGIGSWDEPFTALLEIRGAGVKPNGDMPLNDALAPEFPDGVVNRLVFSEVESDVCYLDPDAHPTSTLSRVEFMAWREYAAAHGIADPDDPASWRKDGRLAWSPERPTLPTKVDTDGDGFPDGYEYYYWYRAHVGYMDGGIHRHLTGRRYNPRNPGEGDFISSAEIEAAMDPLVKGGVIEQDTDNDGLPDLLEMLIGTNPFDFDTDGDGLPDGFEIMLGGTDPLLAETTKGVSDAMRNFDGDAMAFTTPFLETKYVKPVPLVTDMLYTFALVDADGDTDGVQWYVGKTAPNLEDFQPLETCVTGTSFTVGGKTYVTFGKVPVVDGRLAADLDKAVAWEAVTRASLTNSIPSLTNLTWIAEGEPDPESGEPTLTTNATDFVALMPTRFAAGTEVTGVKTATYATLQFAADVTGVNAAWVYGRSVTAVTTGDSLANIGGFGMLAIGRYQDAPKGVRIAALPAEDDGVAYLHHFVYQEFGFDPRTAWNANTPLAPRWGKTVGSGETTETVANNTSANYGYAGISTRTREYTLYDEFLVMSFFLNNGKLTKADVTATQAFPWEKIWAKFTTNGQGPNEPNWEEDNDHYKGRTAETNSGTNGADTDLDGVPDGWELYVMAGPKVYDKKAKEFKYNLVAPYNDGFFSAFGPFVGDAAKASTTDNTAMGANETAAGDGDGLTELQEYAGTDSCAYYCEPWNGNAAAFSATIVRPEEHKNWLNKFFPTDPWNKDTDGDGLNDNEFANQGNFKCGNFMYGTPVDDGKRCCIPGGGLNPCTVDTDRDGLPDPWEAQFAGQTVYAGEDRQVMKGKNGEEGNPLQGLCDGMDGTVFDAYTSPRIRTSGDGSSEEYKVSLDGVDQVVDRDYDRDGLENWQEYLTGAMRCWRYDDPITVWDYVPDAAFFNPLTGEFDLAAAMRHTGIKNENEFWYRLLFDTTSKWYNPHFVTASTPSSQYFSRVTNGWDQVFSEAGTYYMFYNRRNGDLLESTWGEDYYNVKMAPRKYISTSPIAADTDQDGMDDYYELFHGLNPLLGAAAVLKNSNGPCDIVYDAWYVKGVGSPVNALENLWIDRIPGNGKYDFIAHPWLNGLVDADPDGDDIRNQDEAIMPLVAPSAVWLHTDPTPLWMTDSSYGDSIVSRFFRLPSARGMVPVPESIVFGGKEYSLVDCDGYMVLPLIGPVIAPFLPDYWSVTGEGAANWAYSFEENEGYDTDHDSGSDFEEKQGKFRNATDPQDADSPRRRQAMYFPGQNAALQSMPFVKEAYPRAAMGYPDDMSFLQYTVECWVRPEAADPAKVYTVIERTSFTDPSHVADERYVRRNFAIQIRNGKWCTVFDTNGTKDDSIVEVIGQTDAQVGAWTHVAATYDANRLTLYVNGSEDGYVLSNLKPEYGSSAVVTYPAGSGSVNTNDLVVDGSLEALQGTAHAYWFDSEYTQHAFLIGASFREAADGNHLDVTQGLGWGRYKEFFKGYVDEVRVWDGARSSGDIAADMKKRYTRDDALANRDDFYDQWANGMRRYNTDGSGKDMDVIPELRFHWAFDSIPGADNAAAVAQAPHGFLEGDKPIYSRPKDYRIPWWSGIVGAYGSVYEGERNWVPWIPNTVTHLPRFDLTTLDSSYWSEDYAGDEAGTYKFARTAEPVSKWTQYVRNETDKPLAFRTTGRRFWLTHNTGSNATVTLDRQFEFTSRHLNQTGDDLLPLGGAFAKYVDVMWDEQGASSMWEQTGLDGDGDGLPNWWQEYVNQNCREGVPEGTYITWDTPIWYEIGGKKVRITAGEAYQRDLAKGAYVDAKGEVHRESETFKQTADVDGDGMFDWWEDLNGLHTAAPDPAVSHAEGDLDNDGLENYQEFLIAFGAAPYGFYEGLKPGVARSLSDDQAVIDYFLPVPQSSLATIRKLMMARSSVPNAKVPDESISKGEYLGAVFSDHDFMENDIERTLLKGQSSPNVYDPYDDVDADGWDNWSEVRAYQNAGTVRKYDHTEEKLFTQVLTGTTTDNAQKRVDLQNQYGMENVESINVEYQWNNAINNWIETETVRIREAIEIYNVVPAYGGTPVPTVNVRVVYRGAKLRNVLAGYAGNVPATDSDGLVGASFKDSEENPINIHLSFHTTSLETPDALYVQTPSRKEVLDGQMAFALKETSRIKEDTKTVGEYGFVRQGHNKLIVFADTSDDGKWQPGEPYGVVRDVQVGWDKVTEVVVELTDESDVVKRMPLVAAQEGAGGGAGEEEKNASAVGLALVRVIRESINGQTVADSGERIRERVLLQKMLPVAAGLTEIDVLTAKKPDLDWLTLTKDAIKYGIDNVEKVLYRVETVTEDGTNVVGTFEKEFAEERPQAVAVSPVQDAPVYSSAPTFRFDVDEGATAFGIQVAKEDGTVVYDSGVRTLCGLGTDTVGNRSYSFTAPIYAGEPVKSMNGSVLESGRRYMWRVAAFNAKFDAAAGADYSSWMNFQVDVDNVKRYSGLETGYGRVDVAVRYYGPQRLAAGFDQKSIVVEAFDNAGFTGMALAQARVKAGYVDLDSLTDIATANSQLKGVAPGDVYVRAYIDLNDDGTWQKHEPWGYVNKVGNTVPDHYAPVSANVIPASFLKPVCVTVFIEDTDVNKNEYPDCLEQACFPDAEDEKDDEDAFDWWTWANADEDDPTFAADGDVMAYAEVDRYLVAIGPESESDRTKWGYYLLSADETKVPNMSDRGNLAAGNYKLDTCYVYGNGRIWSAPLYGLGVPVKITDPTLLVKDVKPVKVALVHNQVYQAFPYNMRTANPEAFEPDANGIDVANRTKAFTAIDRKLLPRYFEAIGYAPSLDPDRTLDLYIDELFKQGKVTQATALCDAYSLKVGDPDQNRDGVADGWNLYVMFGPNGTVAAATPWTSAAAARTVTPGGEGLWWVQEYDNGRYPTDPWQASTCKDTYTTSEGTFTISDKDAYAYHLKHFEDEEGDKYLDFDNDGLANYAEYDIMKNNNRTLDADNMFSYFGSVTVPSLAGQCVPDYFLKSTKRNAKITDAAVYDYLGFDYTSHDFIESWWKDQYTALQPNSQEKYVDRTWFEAYDDPDGDGWDNWSEARASTDPTSVGHSGLDDVKMNDYPVPSLIAQLTLPPSSTDEKIVIRAYVGDNRAGSDAEWVISGNAGVAEKQKFIGVYPGAKVMTYHLSPGHLTPGMVKVDLRDQNGATVTTTYANGVPQWPPESVIVDTGWLYCVQDRQRIGDSTWGDMLDYHDNPVGTVNYLTGEVTIDFGKMESTYGVVGESETSSSGSGSGDESSGVVLEKRTSTTATTANSYFRLAWRSSSNRDGVTQAFYLSDADSGYLREGPNTFVAFADANGNGEYDPGEAFGCVKDVQVGWDKVVDLNINLTKTSPVIPRFNPMDIGEGAGTNDAVTVEYKGKPVVSDLVDYQTVRIVRWEINGEECTHRTVFRKTAEQLGVITEADVLSDYSFDLDWAYLEKDAAKAGIGFEDIRTVTYAVIVDVGALSPVEEEYVTGWIVKDFSGIRGKATPVAPSKGQTAIVTATRPTFEFKAPSGYPAFAFELCDKDGNVVLSSTNHIGTKNAAGNVTYRPPVYFGWDEEADTTNRLLPNGEYTWRVALLSAKYRHAGDWSDAAKFTVELAKGKVHDTDKGALDVVVRYYGDATVDAEHPIIVQAFRTADFTGVPEGQTAITSTENLSSYDDITTVNAKIYGLAAGDYYICAFIDTTNDVKRMRWESWGYVNKVLSEAAVAGGSDSTVDLYTPVPTKVMRNDTTAAVLFIEDMDCNNDRIPDWMDPTDIPWDWPWPEPPVYEEPPVPVTPEEPHDPNDPGGPIPQWFPEVETDPNDVMACEDLRHVLLVKVALSDADTAARWYAVMDLANESWKLRDSDIPLQTLSTSLHSLVATWKMGRFTGIGTNVTFTGDAKVLDTKFEDIRLIHAQVYAKNGYETGCAAICPNEGNDPRLVDGIAAAEHPHTKPFTRADKYYFCRYLENIGVEGVSEAKMIAEVEAALKGVDPADYETVARPIWSKYTLDPDAIDMDRDDVADSWEAYAMFGQVGLKAFTEGKGIVALADLKVSPFNTADGMLVAPGAGSQLKLVEEFDGGYYPTNPWSADTDRDGVIDFYAYQYHLKGNDAGKDFDLDEKGEWTGDGLSNYAEYLISEVFRYAKLDPEKKMTDGACVDYFRKMGDLYVGEIFTDHDQVDDVWEGAYPAAANRDLYDPERDDDKDGWSNYAEFRAGTDPTTGERSGIVDNTGAEYSRAEFPLPIIEAKVVYNGKGEKPKNVVFKAWNEKDAFDMTCIPDAVWTRTTDATAEAADHEKYVGLKPTGVQRYLLDGGSVIGSSVKIEVLNKNYFDASVADTNKLETGKLVRKVGNPDQAKWYVAAKDDGQGNIVTISTTDQRTIGTLDAATGIVSIDFSQLTGKTFGDRNENKGFATETTPTEGNAGYDEFTFEGSHVKIEWKARETKLSLDGAYYLAEADGEKATSTEDKDKEDAEEGESRGNGRVKEGLNTFVCYAADASGKYVPGAPYGIVRGVDVGWQGAAFTVELMEVSPIFSRISLYDVSGMSDDRAVAFGGPLPDMSDYEGNVPRAANKDLREHVRVVPYMVTGSKQKDSPEDALRGFRYLDRGDKPLVEPRVVAEFDISLNEKPLLTEADFLKNGAFDIDWEKCASEITDLQNVKDAVGSVTAIRYRLVFGANGPVGGMAAETAKATIEAYPFLVERRFDVAWTAPKCEGVIGGAGLTPAGVVYTAHPTFVWSMPNESAWAKLYGSSYTAFKIRIRDANKDIVYESDVMRAPAQDAEDRFVWTAPISVGDQTPQGRIFANNATYTWDVAMFNAKFQPTAKNVEWSSDGKFSTSVNTQQPQNDATFSSIGVTVKYTGPVAVLDGCESVTNSMKNSAGASIAAVQGIVRVQAFETADFSGVPAAETYVANKTALTDATDVLTNACLKGLAAGTYYIRAYIDMNGNFEKDEFESWGYAKEPVTVGSDVIRLPAVGLYIEDADTNGNWYPDAWEYAYLGKWAKGWSEIRGSEAAKPLPDGKIVLSSAVYDQMVSGLAGVSTGLSGSKITVFQDEKFAKLILKPYYDYKSKVETTFDAIRKAVEKKVVDKTLKITAITLDTAKSQVILTMDAETDYANLVAGNFASRLYDLDAMGIESTVTVQVWKKSTLAQENWELVGEFEKTFDKGEAEVEVSVRDNGAAVDPTSGFYMIKVVQ